MSADPRRQIPRTDVTLRDARLGRSRERLGDALVKEIIRAAQQRVRTGEMGPEQLVDEALRQMPATASSLTRVVNATGVVLHTNLGRAPLSGAAVEALIDATGYVDVEFDVRSGARAPRGRGTIAALLRAVPAAQGALVVNNGAAALALVATALASGREIIISRGELIEIGDGFRIPDLLQSTGARLREVGTTNRTNLADYAAAVSDRTALILKVHPSNFAIEGFTTSVGIAELASLGVPVVGDIGSGLLVPDPRLPHEPDATSWLQDGATLVTGSGDKLLGGPQAGLILGSQELVATLRRHPLQRALRVDKLTLAALEATLRGPRPPTLAALHADPGALRARTERLTWGLRDAGLENVRIVPNPGLVGGGGAPQVRLPGWAVELPWTLAARLRGGRPPIVARVESDRCLLDLRCVPEELDETVRQAVTAAHDAILAEDPPCT